jgi:hypothetical protein
MRQESDVLENRTLTWLFDVKYCIQKACVDDMGWKRSSQTSRTR